MSGLWPNISQPPTQNRSVVLVGGVQAWDFPGGVCFKQRKVRSSLRFFWLRSGSSAQLDDSSNAGSRHIYCAGWRIDEAWQLYQCRWAWTERITHMLSIKPGKRAVGYTCSIILDGPPPPVVTMRFEPRQHCIFQCTGEFHAIVESQ